MSHHNNDVCWKSALTYKDSAAGLAERGQCDARDRGFGRGVCARVAWEGTAGRAELGEGEFSPGFPPHSRRADSLQEPTGMKPAGWGKGSYPPPPHLFFAPRRNSTIINASFLFCCRVAPRHIRKGE